MIEQCTSLRELEHYVRSTFKMSKYQWEGMMKTYRRLSHQNRKRKEELALTSSSLDNTANPLGQKESNRYYEQQR